VCERSGRFWLVGRKHICAAELGTGRILRRMTLMDEDRVDGSETMKVTSSKETAEKEISPLTPLEDVTVTTTGTRNGSVRHRLVYTISIHRLLHGVLPIPP